LKSNSSEAEFLIHHTVYNPKY